MKRFPSKSNGKFLPGGAARHYQSAVAAYSRKDFAGALAHLDQALTLAPRYIDAHSYRGYTLAALGNLQGALESHLKVIELSPQDARAHNEVGQIKGTLGDTAGALSSFERAVGLNPLLGEAWFNRGRALSLMQRYAAALVSFDRAVALMPKNPDAHTNRGATLEMLGEAEGALASYDESLAIWQARGECAVPTGSAPDVNYARTRYNRALCLLSLGRLSEGWSDHEWRWFLSEKDRRTFAVPQWTGKESLEGKTVLVHAEQGIGDNIQFCRYLPRLEALGARVLFGIRPQEKGLQTLLSGLGAPFDFVSWQDETLAYDYHCPMMSLPFAFGTDHSTIPAPLESLAVPAALARKWRKLLGSHGFRIGISWQGNPNHARDKQRSFALSYLAGIAAIPGVRLINLHRGPGERQIAEVPFAVENHAEARSDGPDGWLDTAGCLSQCDLVVSCDTSIAHLAGTLGIPTCVALPYAPDWRWMLSGSDSPWYPSMQLFRQQQPDAWIPVFEEIGDAVSRCVLGRTQRKMREERSSILAKVLRGRFPWVLDLRAAEAEPTKRSGGSQPE